MNRSLFTAALVFSLPAFAHESTILDQLKSASWRGAGVSRGIAVKFHLDNVDPDEIGALNRWYPLEGEEGQYSAVRFTPQKGMGVQEVSFTAPNSTTAGVTCSVAEDRIVNLYVTDQTTPSNTATPDVSVIVPGQPGASDPLVVFDVLLPQALWVPAGHSVFVAIEHPGTWPSVGCLSITGAAADDKEREFWSFATDVPFDWTGWEDLGFTDKPLVSIAGYLVL